MDTKIENNEEKRILERIEINECLVRLQSNHKCHKHREGEFQVLSAANVITESFWTRAVTLKNKMVIINVVPFITDEHQTRRNTRLPVMLRVSESPEQTL